MRIISGKLKGRSINFLKNLKTRPLKDKVRESIFNILQHSKFVKIKINDANILDLYSGIGSFGIESISRNAKKVTFIEKDISAINVLKENLNKLSIVDKSKIYNNNVEEILNRNLNDKFNIFFLDPPFADLNYIQNLKLIKKHNYFSVNHIIVIHRERKSKEELKNILETIKIKYYGRSKIIFGKFN